MNEQDFLIKSLQEEIESLKNELTITKEHLKKYTAPSRSKTYYENHKEEVKQKVRDYQERTQYKPTTTPEKRKEYNRKAYLKRKEKINHTTENIKELII